MPTQNNNHQGTKVALAALILMMTCAIALYIHEGYQAVGLAVPSPEMEDFNGSSGKVLGIVSLQNYSDSKINQMYGVALSLMCFAGLAGTSIFSALFYLRMKTWARDRQQLLGNNNFTLFGRQILCGGSQFPFVVGVGLFSIAAMVSLMVSGLIAAHELKVTDSSSACLSASLFTGSCALILGLVLLVSQCRLPCIAPRVVDHNQTADNLPPMIAV